MTIVTNLSFCDLSRYFCLGTEINLFIACINTETVFEMLKIALNKTLLDVMILSLSFYMFDVMILTNLKLYETEQIKRICFIKTSSIVLTFKKFITKEKKNNISSTNLIKNNT